MYLVLDPESRKAVFTEADPTKDGCKLEIVADTTLDPFDELSLSLWPEGHESPRPTTGRSAVNPKHHRVFKTPREMKVDGFLFVAAGLPELHCTWGDFLKSSNE